jgi:hypothetical protein
LFRKTDGPRGQSTNAVPEEVTRIAEVMSAFPAPWALAGGWAVDAWLGRVTREHQDVDPIIFDQPALFEYLAGWQLIGHEESKENEGADLWDGRPLFPPAHLHGRPPDLSGPLPERFDDSGMRVVFPEDGFWLDIQLCEREDQDWILYRDPRLALPLTECIQQSAWSLPTVTPQVILFFKATLYVGTKNHLRPTDHLDFAALLPLLTGEQRAWLQDAIARVYVGEHPWVNQM